METLIELKKLRQVKTEDLAKVINVSLNMARKYKSKPWEYDPPTTKAVAIQRAFNISTTFWSDIRTCHNENIPDAEDKNKIENVS